MAPDKESTFAPPPILNMETTEPWMIQPTEQFWCDHQKWLQDLGYMLRARYLPGWVPSWKDTKKPWYRCEDARIGIRQHLLDATRMSDGTFVMMKLVEKSLHPYEAEIGTFLSSEPLASDPCNHCVPLFSTLQVPDDEDKLIIIMPLLRVHDDPRFDTIGEAVEFFRQIFEGLQFMHKHHVAHRDCMDMNIMMDASSMYPESYHPLNISMKRNYNGSARHFTRTQRPPRYYLTDFGISRRYSPTARPPLEDPIWGGDKTVPEFQTSNDPRDPFPTDVYYLGNMIRQNFLLGTLSTSAKLGFDFMEPLVADMVKDDPNERPTMDEVVQRFETIRHGLSRWTLRSRVIKSRDSSLAGISRTISHWKRRIVYIMKRVPPTPIP